jgi:choice-of-anchor B domain-containing protein
VDVTDVHHPVWVGSLERTNGSNRTLWRDIKVYGNHAYIVSDNAGRHGVQVFDLTELRRFDGAPIEFAEFAHYDGVASAHNIVIDEAEPFAYVVGASGGSNDCGGGLHILNIEDPRNPVFLGCFADTATGRRGTGYSHDAMCVRYHGPDADYQGREICFGANETGLSIADVTDKRAPAAIGLAEYPNTAYTHQGWISEDHTYFFVNDEGDEVAGLTRGTRTLVFDVSELDDPVLVAQHVTDSPATDHNLYVRGNLMYQSNYRSGLHVYDVSDPRHMRKLGYFDTVPWGSDEGMGNLSTGALGSWSNYPFFDSGVVVVTSGLEGLFILRLQADRE